MKKQLRDYTTYSWDGKEKLESTTFGDDEIKKWWFLTIGWIPDETELKMLVEEEPGIAVLISEIFNHERTRRRWKKEDAANE